MASSNPLSGLVQKEERFHLYMHQRWSGRDRNQLITVDHKQPGYFGQSVAFDYPVTLGPDLNSQLLARARGVFTGAGLLAWGAQTVTSTSMKFVAGRFAGSTLEFRGYCDAPYTNFEWAIVGGTGEFTLAQGILKAQINQQDNFGRSHLINIHVIYYPGFGI